MSRPPHSSAVHVSRPYLPHLSLTLLTDCVHEGAWNREFFTSIIKLGAWLGGLGIISQKARLFPGIFLYFHTYCTLYIIRLIERDYHIFLQDTSRQGYSPDPSRQIEGSGIH